MKEKQTYQFKTKIEQLLDLLAILENFISADALNKIRDSKFSNLKIFIKIASYLAIVQCFLVILFR